MQILTTATRRPELLARTYESFAQNILGVRLDACDLLINIDPLPDDKNNDEVIRVAESFFNTVTVNEPEKPDFGAAVKWLFGRASGEYVFGLEEDWELTAPVSINSLTPYFANPKLAAVNLRAYPWFRPNYPPCLSPGLWRVSACHEIAEMLVAGSNPEKQLRTTEAVKRWHGYQYPDMGVTIVKDIGREWLEQSGYAKDGGATFNRWVKP